MSTRSCERNACPQLATVLVGNIDTGSIEALCSAHALAFYADVPTARPNLGRTNPLWREWTMAHQFHVGAAKDLTEAR